MKSSDCVGRELDGTYSCCASARKKSLVEASDRFRLYCNSKSDLAPVPNAQNAPFGCT